MTSRRGRGLLSFKLAWTYGKGRHNFMPLQTRVCRYKSRQEVVSVWLPTSLILHLSVCACPAFNWTLVLGAVLELSLSFQLIWIASVSIGRLCQDRRPSCYPSCCCCSVLNQRAPWGVRGNPSPFSLWRIGWWHYLDGEVHNPEVSCWI